MIYIGLLDFNNSLNVIYEMCSIFESYTYAPPTAVRKGSLTLCYGKLSPKQDIDEVWQNASSILMGRILDKPQFGSFGKRDFENLSDEDTEEVLRKIWGKYVCIHGNKNRFRIIIDSTGQLPFFYHLSSDGNVLFSSNIEIIFKFLNKKPEYNWTYLCSYLVYGDSSAIQTPFKGIYELPPACCLTITKNERKIEPFWNPYFSNRTIPPPKEKDATDILQATLKSLVKPYKNICLSLSGGLDSSSIAYCLKAIKREDQTLIALNYFHSAIRSSNELFYARKACQEADIELIEIETSHSLPFELSLKQLSLNPNKPFSGLISLKTLELTSKYIPSNDSCIFLSGHGSDHIFMCPPTKKSVSDYVLEKGFSGSKKQLKDMAAFYRDSLFSVLKVNIISLVFYFLHQNSEKRRLKVLQNKLPDWINKDLRQQISSDFKHPIYDHLPRQIFPGKYAQIDALYEGLASIHMEMNPINPTCYPFLYEPVVEFALSFPTYDLFNKGYDRYPLRKAVSERFKTDIVWRRDKGETTGILQLGVKKNLGSILELCLEGQFVKQGFIDKKGLYKTIQLISNGDNNHLWPFIHLASIEMFLRYWEENPNGKHIKLYS